MKIIEVQSFTLEEFNATASEFLEAPYDFRDNYDDKYDSRFLGFKDSEPDPDSYDFEDKERFKAGTSRIGNFSVLRLLYHSGIIQHNHVLIEQWD